MLACERGELSIVRELLENDVDVNAVDNVRSILLCVKMLTACVISYVWREEYMDSPFTQADPLFNSYNGWQLEGAEYLYIQ